ncbi:MAG: YkgJ family cysteine cluster protein [Planctomycetaceae bacterium]|jgi:Fe-S-cluster containining protein|nr:YkgJ family cysteine cluster protein [Planctomycetaceae bacterium]
MVTKSLWYKDGLRFGCTSCGSCCGGGPGFVWVTQNEIERLAAKFGITPELFEKLFVWTVKEGHRSLKEYPNGDCVLLDEKTKKCKFYEERPIQCKTWPFWDQNLNKKIFWDLMSEHCPGCNRGRLYSLDEIEKQRTAIEL